MPSTYVQPSGERPVESGADTELVKLPTSDILKLSLWPLCGAFGLGHVLRSELAAKGLQGIWMGRPKNWVMPASAHEERLCSDSVS